MDKLNIAICEDTYDDQKKLRNILDKSSIPLNYIFFNSGEDFLKSFKIGAYDLILTDIYMKDLTGVDVATSIRKMDLEIPIAFITTSQDHTLQGYRLKVFRYIEKPYKEELIEEVLAAAKIKKDSLPAIHIYKNRKEIKIPLKNITYIEQQSHNLLIHIKNGDVIKLYEKISKYSYLLDQQTFFEPHKSFYVNLIYVRSICVSLRCFVMHDGTNVPIRREVFSSAKKAYEDLLFSQTRGV